MKLSILLQKIAEKKIIGNDEIEIKGISIDSRKTGQDYAFIAFKGTQVDGHDFIEQSIDKGAKAIICEVLPTNLRNDITYVQIEDPESAIGSIATVFYGDPTTKFKLVGVTGTNGKTTIATLLYRMFLKFGYKVGLLSTVCNYVNETAYQATQTTPDPVTLNELLGKMADEGCQYAFMEVSSHSIAQNRISGLHFTGGIFTNITRDHLDYHKTFENYLKAKKKFFDDLPATAFAITNLDDKHGEIMLQNTKATKYTYSLQTLCDFKGKIIEDHFEGMLLNINGQDVSLHFTGRFNASNLLAVFGAATLLGKSKEDVLVALSTLYPVSGRFESIRSPKGFSAIVDYAHTPDAIVNVLDTIKEVLSGKGKIITVVGAGGNRDKGKRPIMAQEAEKRSDKVIITSDNPRFEDPNDIINDMLAGLNDEQRQNVISITDRKEAIRTACMLAQKGDVILVAGKGHENYQDVKGMKHHFDDKEVLREIFGI